MTVVILTVMITPIMIALTCEALASVPSSWREGAIALGLNPLRAILAVTVRAARPAIVAAAVLATARALGEAIMISMVSGSRAFKPNLDHGLLVFLYSAAAHLRLRDRRLPRRDRRPGARLLAVCVRAAAAARRLRAVGVRLPDQAAAAQVPGARMSTLVPFDFDEPRAMQTGRGRRSSPLSWRWRDRFALVLAWSAGIALILIAGAIVGYFAFRGVQYLRPGLALLETQVSTTPGRQRRLPGPAAGHHDPDARRHRAGAPAGA